MFWIVVDWHLRTSMKGTAKAFVMLTHEAFLHERRSTHQAVAPLCISCNWKMDHPGLKLAANDISWHNDRLWLWQSLQHGTSMHKCKSGQPKFNMLSCGAKNTSTHKGHGPLSVANFIWREVLKKAKSNKPTTLKKLLVLLTHSFSIYILINIELFWIYVSSSGLILHNFAESHNEHHHKVRLRHMT